MGSAFFLWRNQNCCVFLSFRFLNDSPRRFAAGTVLSLFVFPLPHKSPAALRRGKAFISNRFRASLSFLFGRFSSFIRFFLTLFSDRSRRKAAGPVLSRSPSFLFLFLIKVPPLCGGAFLSLLKLFFFFSRSLVFSPNFPFYPFFIPFSPSSRFLSNNFLKNFTKTYCFFCKYMV